MSIIIRLQNLPWSANSVDIRRFFSGLSIPEGGVHIVGGEMGDAFIAFSTDEDARLAMAKDGGKIKDMQIKLLLSSRTEMMRVIEQARQQNMVVPQPHIVSQPSILPLQQPARIMTPTSPEPERRRGRSPSPHRRSRDRSPGRDRRRSPDDRRSSKRDRSRSPSRSSRSYSRDMDRRSDRFKRDDRRYDDSRYRDEKRSGRDSQEPKKYADADHVNSRSQLHATEGFRNMQTIYDQLNSAIPGLHPFGNPQPEVKTFSETYAHTSTSSSVQLPQSEQIMTHKSVSFPPIANQKQLSSAYPHEQAQFRTLPFESSITSAKDAPSSVESQTTKPRRRTRFEPEIAPPPASSHFPAADSKSSVENQRDAPYKDVRSVSETFSDARNVWPHEAVERSDNTTWNDNRQGLLHSSMPKSGDFVQVVPMDLDSSPSDMSPDKETFETVSTRGASSFVMNNTTARNDDLRRDSQSRVLPSLSDKVHSIHDRAVVSHSDNRGPPMQDRGLVSHSGNRAPPMQERGSVSHAGNRGPPMQDRGLVSHVENRGPVSHVENRGPSMQDRVTVSHIENRRPFMQDRGPSSRDEDTRPLMQDRRPAPRDEDSRPLMQERGPTSHDEDRRPLMQNRGLAAHDEDRRPLMQDRGPISHSDNRGMLLHERGPASHVENRGQPMQNDTSGRIPPSLTVEVRGLPPDARIDDILDLFHGIPLPAANIRIEASEHGFEKAFIRFVSTADFQEALNRNRRFTHEGRCELVPCPAAAFDSAPRSQKHKPKPKPRDEDLTVQLRGLPFSCKDDDVVQFFDGLGILDLYVEISPDGRASGTGFVEFGTPEDFRAALAMNGKMIGHRYITVSVASKEMMAFARGDEYNVPIPPSGPHSNPNFPNSNRPHHQNHVRPVPNQIRPAGPLMNQVRQEPPAVQRPPPCIAMKSLPEGAGNRDIADFLGQIGVMPRAVHIMLRPDQTPSGDAFVEFGSPADMEAALQLNGKFMMGKRVSVKPIPFHEMSEIVGRPSPMPPPPTPAPLLRTPGDMERPRRPLLPQGPNDASFRERPRMEPPNRGTRPHMEPFKGQMERPVGPGRMRGPWPRAFNGGNRPEGRFPPPSTDRGVKDFGSPGCVVSINNLHFKAGLEELLDFFKDYKVSKDSIFRRYNENGQTTGEARVAFPTPRDAQRAVRELNRKPIMGRPLSLSIL